ncbi:MAG: DUF2147 domain-containing protein [Hyphomicrobiaceae bacterium]
MASLASKMRVCCYAFGLALLFTPHGGNAEPTTPRAGANPTGTWIDHTGRGAVEIKDCAGKLCGHIVWIEDGQPPEACGKEIIGDVKFVGDGKWDQGWIYDPELDSEFDVELTPLANGNLQVLGYAGFKTLSETMIWKRAPADLKPCSVGGVVAVK